MSSRLLELRRRHRLLGAAIGAAMIPILVPGVAGLQVLLTHPRADDGWLVAWGAAPASVVMGGVLGPTAARARWRGGIVVAVVAAALGVVVGAVSLTAAMILPSIAGGEANLLAMVYVPAFAAVGVALMGVPTLLAALPFTVVWTALVRRAAIPTPSINPPIS